MTADKISLTLFDILSYLLPGYLVLFAISIVESTFFESELLTLARISDNWFVSSVMAYFLGHFSHRTASYLTNARPAWFDDKSQRLIGSLYYHVRKLLSDMHSIEFKNGERIRSLETYLLADSYIVASGNTAERDSMLAREGFHKTSMVAFGIDALVVFVTLFAGGTRLQLAAGSYYSLNFACSLLLFLALVVMTLVFWRGYTFFNRLKINNTLLLAMTLRTLDKERLDKHE